MTNLVHSSRPRLDLVQTNPEHDLVHSSRSSMRTNGREESENERRERYSSSSGIAAADHIHGDRNQARRRSLLTALECRPRGERSRRRIGTCDQRVTARPAAQSLCGLWRRGRTLDHRPEVRS